MGQRTKLTQRDLGYGASARELQWQRKTRHCEDAGSKRCTTTWRWRTQNFSDKSWQLNGAALGSQSVLSQATNYPIQQNSHMLRRHGNRTAAVEPGFSSDRCSEIQPHQVEPLRQVVVFIRSGTARNPEPLQLLQMSTCSLNRTSHDMPEANATQRPQSSLLDRYRGFELDPWANGRLPAAWSLQHADPTWKEVGGTPYAACATICTGAWTLFRAAKALGGSPIPGACGRHMGLCAALIRQPSYTSSKSTRPISR